MEEQRALPQMLGRTSPCDGCSHANECANFQLACVDYVAFMACGAVQNTSRNPTHRCYIQLFCTENKNNLTPDDIILISKLSKIRGIDNNKISETFDILPRHVKNIRDEYNMYKPRKK